MAVTYGFFNSINGDRVYNADQMSQYFDGLITNGVYESVGGALQVLAGTGLSVNVQTGRAVINCKWIRNDAVLTLPITQAHSVLNRYTAVILRLDLSGRLVEITTKDGTPASTPTKPAMETSSTIVELCLAYIYVAAGATSISQADITDTRPSSLCGWVTGLIQQVDTSQLFLQWQTAYQEYYDDMTAQFDAWFAALTQQLNVNTYVDKYEKRTVLQSGASNIIPMDMTGYTYDSDDIISVFINGLLGASGIDYTLDTSGSTPTIQPNATAAGTEVQIIVYKSRIGFNQG